MKIIIKKTPCNIFLGDSDVDKLDDDRISLFKMATAFSMFDDKQKKDYLLCFHSRAMGKTHEELLSVICAYTREVENSDRMSASEAVEILKEGKKKRAAKKLLECVKYKNMTVQPANTEEGRVELNQSAEGSKSSAEHADSGTINETLEQ